MGGRGSMSGTGQKRGLSFGSNGNSKSKELFPSQINRRSHTGDEDRFISGFKGRHDKSPIEYGALIDDRGYATGYFQGGRGSVSLPADRLGGQHITHNHPVGGWANFSGGDLETWATSGARGISAVSRSYKVRSNASEALKRAVGNRQAGTYKVTKGTHFKSAEFMEALRKVKVRDDDYDRDLHKWLKRNQRTYGYTYSFKRE